MALAALASTAIAIGAYWYWSPYLAIKSMKAAAQTKDADAFNEYVDYAKLRESLKGQFSARAAGILANSSGGSDSERAGSTLGAMIGFAMIERMIDAMVRPEMIMKAMNNARLQNPAAAGPESTGANYAEGDKIRWLLERKGSSKVIAYGEDLTEPTPESSRVGFVFEREGFAGWKLTEIRLPDTN